MSDDLYNVGKKDALDSVVRNMRYWRLRASVACLVAVAFSFTWNRQLAFVAFAVLCTVEVAYFVLCREVNSTKEIGG